VEVATKRLELLHKLVPKAVRFAVLVNPANAAIAETTLRAVQDASRTIGLQIHVVNASTGREIDAAFATAARERLDALFVAGDVFFVSRRVQFSTLATREPVTARAMVRFPSRIKVSGPPEEKGAAPLRYNETGIVVQSTLVGSASHLWVGGINT
jgi:hypothetical protein